MKLRKMTQKEAIEFCSQLDFFDYEEEKKELGEITVYIEEEEEEVEND